MANLYITKFSSIAVLVLALSSHQSEAASIDFEYDVDGSSAPRTTTGTTYRGVAYDSASASTQEGYLGTIGDAYHYISGTKIGGDVYDGYGYLSGRPNHSTSSAYATPFNGLIGARYTSALATGEAHAPLGFRWFDSFTNNTSQDISAIIRFYGNLGSDDDSTLLGHAAPGYVIMADDRARGLDQTPVHIYSDANYASNVQVHANTGNDEVYFDYIVNVAPGKTASILVFNYLVVDPARLTDATGASQREIELGKKLAADFLNNPYLAGLTADQLASIVNFDIKLDGTLPSAGAAGQIAGNSLALFNNLLDVNQAFTGAGIQLTHDNISPLAYVPVSQSGGSEGAAQIASLIGQSGGKLRAGTDEHELYMLGGYTKGRDHSADAAMSHSGYALALGYEFSNDASSRYGLAFGYMNSSAEIAGSYSDYSGEQYLISPYARWTLPSDITIDARASLSSDNWSYIRNSGTLNASASFDGYSLGASLKASKAYETGGVTLTPFAKVSLVHSHFNTYEEQGAGYANLEIPSYRLSTIEALAGIGLSDKWQLEDNQTLSTFANFSLGKSYSADQNLTTRFAGSSLYYDNMINGKDDLFGRLDLGASLQLSETTELMLSYSGQFTEDTTQHAVTSKFSVKF